jgi:competence ComEA-like helix-hairpin-helix protein
MKKVLFSFILLSLAFPIFVLAEQIDINTATLSQLDELTGIGPTYAQRIIDGRPYSSVDDLLRVKGIGPATLQKIKDQGLACVNCESSTVVADTQIPEPTPAPVPEINYSGGVFINEILPNPQGADETDEWIELYNSNNFDADLSGWQLQDRAGTITTYTIPAITKILANGFLVFKRPDTKIMLNNDGDGVNLLTPDGKIVDSLGFVNAPLGQSYNKVNDDWAWSTTLTPAAKNIITAVKKAVAAAKTLPKAENSVKNDGVEPGLADLTQSINTNQDNTLGNPWFLFFTVLATTIVLAIIVLFIKLRFKDVTKT